MFLFSFADACLCISSTLLATWFMFDNTHYSEESYDKTVTKFRPAHFLFVTESIGKLVIWH